jgi:predicted membrane-bound spermidine synthase
MAPHHRTRPVAGLLFASGFCALVYQIGWLREFRLIFGASTAASAAVLAIFIGGLGLGGWLLGRRADSDARPLAFYAQLEAIVALSAAASPLLLALVRQLYVLLGGTARLGLVGGTILRLVLSALVLAIPTIAMGGTLPAAARAITGPDDQRRRQLATLYGCNTLGAVIGCLVATFLALELFGTRSTLWLAAAINLLVAIVAHWMSDSVGEITESDTPADTAVVEAQAPVGFVLTASGVVGFAFFLMELVWYRMLGPLLGGSVFTFGLILAVALVGIGIGGLLYARLGVDRPATIGAFAFTCLLEAVAIAAAFALGDDLSTLAIVLTPFSRLGFLAQVSGWTAVTAIVVLPAALVAGYQFPMLVALLGRGREGLGRQLGLTYATNTIGAIIGSLAGGFGVLPWLSAPGAWRLVAALLLVLGVAAIVIRSKAHVTFALVPQMALVVIAAVLLTATGPTAAWRHAPIGAGRVHVETFTSPNKWVSWTRARQRSVVWEGDGVESSVALAADTDGYAFIVNGKSDGSLISDAGTQVMLGMLGPILNPSARRTLVIGLGTGSSAGWLAAIPSMEHVDVVELEPLIVDVAKACTVANHDVLHNPKIHLSIGDAREWLQLTPEHYDVIASEPSNPFRAGVASLFTREYYKAADARLTQDGLFLQWIQGYEIDPRTLRTIYATMASVFPHVESWQTSSYDLVLVGARHPIAYQSSVITKVIEQEPFKTALRGAWHTTSLNGLFSHYVGGNAVTQAIAAMPGVERNVDDRNVVEFGISRTVGRTGEPMIQDIRNVARALGVADPVVDGRPLDPSVLRTALVSYYAATGYAGDIQAGGTPIERARQTALQAFFGQQNSSVVKSIWQTQTDGPRDPVELAMLAILEAASGSDNALPYIERIRSYEPAEADTILASLLARQGKADDATTALESALKEMETDPWPLQIVKDRALSLARELGVRSPALARRMIASLNAPFAGGAMPDDRLRVAAELTRVGGLAQTCKGPMHALEPYSPWDLEMLTLRRDCYAASGDPLLTRAERDLEAFARLEPQPFVVMRASIER